MLFDLRGRGRRRTVQVIYITLAIIFLLGFVGLGVGGGFGSGGIFSAFTENKGSGGASFSSEARKYKKLTQQQPTSVSAWEGLLNAQLHEAGGEAYVTRSGAVTEKGKELYAQIAQSWRRYLALNPTNPSTRISKEVLQVFTEEGLNDPAAAVQVLQIIVGAEPNSAHYYSFLAAYAYKAHNTRVGDLAAQKAVGLVPSVDRPRLKSQLAALKKNPTGTETTTTTAPASGTYTVPGTVSTPAGSPSGKKK